MSDIFTQSIKTKNYVDTKTELSNKLNVILAKKLAEKKVEVTKKMNESMVIDQGSAPVEVVALGDSPVIEFNDGSSQVIDQATAELLNSAWYMFDDTEARNDFEELINDSMEGMIDAIAIAKEILDRDDT